MIDAIEDMEYEINVGVQFISDIRFTDDQGMVASSEFGLQKLMDRANANAKKFDMNIKKDKVNGNIKKRRKNYKYSNRSATG